jgi:hypothetical protein
MHQIFLSSGNMVLFLVGDSNNKRKQVAREMTAQYLLQAEKIYTQHLASKSAELSVWDVRIRLFTVVICKFLNFWTFCHTVPLESHC